MYAVQFSLRKHLAVNHHYIRTCSSSCLSHRIRYVELHNYVPPKNDDLTNLPWAQQIRSFGKISCLFLFFKNDSVPYLDIYLFIIVFFLMSPSCKQMLFQTLKYMTFYCKECSRNEDIRRKRLRCFH